MKCWFTGCEKQGFAWWIRQQEVGLCEEHANLCWDTDKKVYINADHKLVSLEVY